jgi:tetratricopeptide (TPR) repeat protein
MAIATSQPDVARRWLARAPIAQVQVSDPLLGAQSHLLAAGVERQSEAYAVAATQLEHATRLAQTHRLAGLEAQIAFERGNLQANRGDLQSALAAFAEALHLAQASSNPVIAAMAENNLAYHALLTGDRASARQHILSAVDLTERYALSFLWQYVHSTAGEIALAHGELEVADQAFMQAFEAAQVWGNRVHMANVRATQAQVALARDDGAEARALLAEARELFGTAIDPFVRDKIARIGAELA